jgi:molybdate transport system permease protein
MYTRKNMKNGVAIILIMLIATLLTSCSFSKERRTEITIAAAASLQEPLDKLVNQYLKDHAHNNIEINVTYGGSGTLAQQIDHGAPVDIFLSAGVEPVNQLKEKHLLTNVKSFLSNDLVLITPRDNPAGVKRIDQLTSDKVSKIAIGTPKIVPAGDYAKETLLNNNMWGKVQNKLIFTKDVKQALAYVETGNVDAAFVYLSDAVHSKGSKVVAKVPKEDHQPILYYEGVVEGANQKEATKFLSFLNEANAQTLLEQAGFHGAKISHPYKNIVDPVALSFKISSIATVFVLVIALLAAKFLSKPKRRGKIFIEMFFMLPLVLPPSVIGFILIVVFGGNSWVGQRVESIFGQGLMFTWQAGILAAVVVSFPLMYQSISLGFSQIDPDIVGAAKVDGGSGWKMFWYIDLPLIIKFILVGSILSFARSLGEFGATLMFAGNIPGKTQTASTAIYMAMEAGDMKLATLLTLALISISFIMLGLIQIVRK